MSLWARGKGVDERCGLFLVPCRVLRGSRCHGEFEVVFFSHQRQLEVRVVSLDAGAPRRSRIALEEQVGKTSAVVSLGFAVVGDEFEQVQSGTIWLLLGCTDFVPRGISLSGDQTSPCR